MSIDQGFFKAKNKIEALNEITARLGGSSEVTDYLAELILSLYSGDSRMKKFPMALFVHEEKPQFTLNDGEMLEGFAINLSTKQKTTLSYMGSADTVFQHKKEQLSEGMKTPENVIAVFITKIPHNQKLAWTVDIVGHLQKRIETVQEKSPIDETKEAASKTFEGKYNLEFLNNETIVSFKRKMKSKDISDIQYYLGELNKWHPHDVWEYQIELNDEVLTITFKTSKELPIPRSSFLKVENQIASLDSDIRRLNR